jgi:hypothetical protein
MAYSLEFTKPQNAIVFGLYEFLPIPTAIYSPLTQIHTTIYCSLSLQQYDVLKMTEDTRK